MPGNFNDRLSSLPKQTDVCNSVLDRVRYCLKHQNLTDYDRMSLLMIGGRYIRGRDVSLQQLVQRGGNEAGVRERKRRAWKLIQALKDQENMATASNRELKYDGI